MKKWDLIKIIMTGGIYGLSGRLRETPEAAQFVAQQAELQKEVDLLSTKSRKVRDTWQAKADVIYDQAVFAGSSEEVVALLTEFIKS